MNLTLTGVQIGLDVATALSVFGAYIAWHYGRKKEKDINQKAQKIKDETLRINEINIINKSIMGVVMPLKNCIAEYLEQQHIGFMVKNLKDSVESSAKDQLLEIIKIHSINASDKDLSSLKKEDLCMFLQKHTEERLQYSFDKLKLEFGNSLYLLLSSRSDKVINLNITALKDFQLVAKYKITQDQKHEFIRSMSIKFLHDLLLCIYDDDTKALDYTKALLLNTTGEVRLETSFGTYDKYKEEFAKIAQ